MITSATSLREVLKAFETVPDRYLILSPELNILTASDAYLEATQTQREKIRGKNLFEVFAGNPADLKASLEQVLRTRQPHQMALPPGDGPRPDRCDAKYWRPLNTPVLDEQGNVRYIIHKLQEVTGLVRHNRQIQALKQQVAFLSRQARASAGEPTKAALESQQLLQTVFDASPNSIVVFRIMYTREGEVLDFEILHCNTFTLQTTGLNLADVIGKPFSQVFPHVRETSILHEFKKVASTGVIADFEQWYEGEGLHHWFRFIVNKLGDLLVVTTEDITERKKAEQQIRKKNELLEAILNAPNIGVTVYEAVRNHQGAIIDFRFVLLNQLTIRLWGGRDLTGKRLLEVFPGNAELMADYRQVVETGVMHEREILYRHEGYNNWFYISASKFGDGMVIRWEDITEKKNAELEVLRMKDLLAERAQDKYLALFNNMDQGFCIIEMIFDARQEPVDYRFIEVNPVFEKQTGLKNAVGRSMRELQPAHEETWFRIYGNVVKTGKSIHFENEAAHPEGGIWYEVYAFPFGPAGSHLVAILFNDITERKRREANLAFLAEVAEEYSRLSSAGKIMQMAGTRIGAYLKVSTCNFLEVEESRDEDMTVSYTWRNKDAGNGLQTFRLKDYLHEEFRRASRAGKATVISNTQTDARTDAHACARFKIGAFLSVPFHRNGKWKYLLSVTDTGPRDWREDETELLEELSARIFPRLERARAEEALRESEERFRLFVTASTDTLYKMSADWSRMLDLHGKGFLADTQGPSSTWINKYIPRQDQAQVLAAIREAIRTSSIFELEHRVFRADGQIGWAYSRAVPVLNEQGEITEWFGAASDFTLRKQAEQQLKDFNALLEEQVSERTRALKASNERFQAAINVSPVVLSILKAVRNSRQQITDFHFDWASKSGQEMVGKDVTGLRLTEQFPYLKAIGVFQKFANTVETGAPTDYECLYNAEGFDLWARWRAVRFDDGLFASVEDITHRKKAEAETLKNLALLQQSEEVALMGSWEYDIETGRFHWSEGMYRLFGLPAGSPVTLQSYLDPAVAEDLPVVDRIYRNLTRNHVAFDETLRIQVRGQVLTLKVRATVLRRDTGEPVKMLGIDLDISEVRRLEQENLQMRLNQQKALLIGILEAQEEERRRISESLHNGVGQVLYATKLNLDQVVQQLPKGSQQHNQVLEKTQHLLDDAIQETRRVSHELVPMVLRDFGLVYGIKDLCNKFNGGALQVECDIEGFEEKLEPYMVIALYRISQELITNIVKHAQATRAKLVLEKEEGEITLKVWDNGKGFSQQSGKKKGIGLQTISDRVKLLNGTLAITTPDTQRGTLIYIKIPLS